MKITKIFILSISISLLCLGLCCNAKHCIKIGGSYEGNPVDFEYCYDSKKSDDNGIPTLESNQGDSFLISEDQAKKIVEKLKGVISSSKAEDGKHALAPIKELLEILKEK